MGVGAVRALPHYIINMDRNKKAILIFLIFLLAILALVFLLPKKKFKEVVEYERNNIIVNQTEHMYYEDILHVGLNELGITNEIILIRTSQSKDGLDEYDLKGSIITNGQQYLVQIYDIPQSESIQVLAHELIHLDQYRSGRLKIVNDSIFYEDNVYMKGQLPPYRNRPWEREAFGRQRDLELAIEDHILE